MYNKAIGATFLENGKWTATIGKMVFTTRSRKQSVEGLLQQIIMLYASKEYKERTRMTAD
jgi:hypothetical protein